MRSPLPFAAVVLALVAADRRLDKPVDLNGYFPFAVPASKAEWDARRERLREQTLVALGLWPTPERTPLNAVVHSPIDRDGYTVEKVFFAGRPGHTVTGNLWRPKGVAGKRPAVIYAHGHWNNGRFHDAGEKRAQADVAAGAEGTVESGRFFFQAACSQLARLGFVVFQLDMVGYADSTAIPHREGFKDAAAELRLQSFMGLQAWNAVRAVDFLASLPDVDPARIGVTGASGGGTQSFLLAAIDDRVAASAPAVMVSTAMQGGCVCENCSHLRVGTGNIELAALTTPRPQLLIGAEDWTKEVETKGYPELRQLYALYGAADRIWCKCFTQFPHNYNQVNREVMYHFFNKHLCGTNAPVKERPFVPIPVAELSVFDAAHPRPADELPAAELRKAMAADSDAQMAKLFPKDAATLAEFRKVVGPALRAMVHDELPPAGEVEVVERRGDVSFLSRRGAGERVPVEVVRGPAFGGTAVVWVHPEGRAGLRSGGKLTPAARALIDRKAAVVAFDAYGTGELTPPRGVDPKYAGFTFGYNRSLLAERVHDTLTAVAFAKSLPGVKSVHLVGWDKAGPWAVLARALCGDAVGRLAADADGFRFENVESTDHPMMLPGAVKYGGLPAFLALCAPGEALFHNHRGTSSGKLSKAAYEAAGAAGKLRREPQKLDPAAVAEWLVR